jgi:hypothetical protein
MLSKENALIEFGLLSQLQIQNKQLRKTLWSMLEKAESLEPGPLKDFMSSMRAFCLPNHIEVHLQHEMREVKKIINK